MVSPSRQTDQPTGARRPAVFAGLSGFDSRGRRYGTVATNSASKYRLHEPRMGLVVLGMPIRHPEAPNGARAAGDRASSLLRARVDADASARCGAEPVPRRARSDRSRPLVAEHAEGSRTAPSGAAPALPTPMMWPAISQHDPGPIHARRARARKPRPSSFC